MLIVLVVVSFDVKKPTFLRRKEEEIGESEREISFSSFKIKERNLCVGGGDEAHMGIMRNM